jgi:CubicO group peptidase (beta-lactamase class C family)/lysophospholipase L1-like esterase
MRRIPIFAAVLLAISTTYAGGLPRSAPEPQGIASSAVLGFVEAADKSIESMNSFMLVRHGHVVAEGWWTPYDAQSPHSLYSLSKSFTSTAVGIAIAEGKLSVDDPVLKFFPEDAPTDPSNNLRSMRVSDLLRMSTGQQTEPPRPLDEDWTKAFLRHAVPFKPGTHFLYNTSATYMLSAIVQRATGEGLLEYLTPRLFEPLGIDHPTWERSPQGIATGGFGLSVRTEDIARFGELLLRKGEWSGKQLVPAGWIEAATARQTSNGSNPASDWDQGYGYQFWRCRNGAYRGDGAFGQYCIVLPDQDAVIAITSGVRDMQAVLNLVWDRLLPAFQPSPLPGDDAASARLEARLRSLALPVVQGGAKAADVGNTSFSFPPNNQKLERLHIETDASTGEFAIVARFGGTDRRLECGAGAWKRSRVAWGGFAEQPVAACGGWTKDGEFTAKLCFYETPFILTTRLKFDGDEVRVGAAMNVGFGPTSQPELIGSAKTAREPEAQAGTTGPLEAADRFAVWEKEIAAYELADRDRPPGKGGVLFIGSSTIRLWKSLAEDFPRHNVINRGFGGSEIVDSTHFADRIIFPYEPSQIFLRAGGNDIHAGRLPSEVAADFADFVAKVRTRLPKTEIVYIGVNPAPARWGENDKYRALNVKIRELAVDMPFVTYIETFDMTMTPAGRPREQFFVDDRLHLNEQGYEALAELVRPYLK